MKNLKQKQTFATLLVVMLGIAGLSVVSAPAAQALTTYTYYTQGCEGMYLYRYIWKKYDYNYWEENTPPYKIDYTVYLGKQLLRYEKGCGTFRIIY